MLSRSNLGGCGNVPDILAVLTIVAIVATVMLGRAVEGRSGRALTRTGQAKHRLAV
jgi:hypothetical protein